MAIYVGRITRLDFQIEADNAEDAKIEVVNALDLGSDGFQRLFTDGHVEIEIEGVLNADGNMTPIAEDDDN